MKKTDGITTRTLARRLFRTSVFENFKERYTDELNAPTLAEYLGQLCRERNITHESVIRLSRLDRIYGHQIFSGIRRPSRDKVIQLAFGFSMTTDEAQRLLLIAKKGALYPRIERDAAILFCLNKKLGVDEARSLIEDLGLTPLGNDLGRD